MKIHNFEENLSDFTLQCRSSWVFCEKCAT